MSNRSILLPYDGIREVMELVFFKADASYFNAYALIESAYFYSDFFRGSTFSLLFFLLPNLYSLSVLIL